jgi:hypothetical protein
MLFLPPQTCQFIDFFWVLVRYWIICFLKSKQDRVERTVSDWALPCHSCWGALTAMPITGLNSCQCFSVCRPAPINMESVVTDLKLLLPTESRVWHPPQLDSPHTRGSLPMQAWCGKFPSSDCVSTKCLWLSENVEISQTKIVTIRVAIQRKSDPMCPGHAST